MKFNSSELKWTRAPKNYEVSDERIVIVTEPETDLWQRTYYGFCPDNAPVLQLTTSEKFFTFTVKAEFDYKNSYDQCGVAMYLDGENWMKASIEYENDEYQRLGSVVTNNGYSDWATTDIGADVSTMWYRFSRRESDFCLESSADGVEFHQMRIFHMFKGAEEISFGLYACSPAESSFEAVFTEMELGECKWELHE